MTGPISGDDMKKLAFAILVFSSPALAQTMSTPSEPVCEPIGRTSKGDLVYSMECRNIPGLPPGEKLPGYNPTPKDTDAPEVATPKLPESK
jgi:hypothetical protein